MPIPKPPTMQGMQPTQDLQEFYQDRLWMGLDLYRTPQDLDMGYLTQAENLYNVGGILMIRPGKKAQLMSPMQDSHSNPLPVYVMGSFLDTDGATWILFTAGGKLYKVQNGTDTATEITQTGGGSLSLNSPTVRMARYGQYAYFIDGSSNGALYRTDLTNTQTVTALSQPTDAPVATAISASALPGFWPSTTGAQYDAPPQYTSGTATAVATAVLSGSAISSISIVNGGYGYSASAPPTVTIVDNTTGTSGSGVSIGTISVNSDGQITNIHVTSPGSGYTAPVVIISAPAGQPCNAFPLSWTQTASGDTWASSGGNLGWVPSALPMYGEGSGGVSGSMQSIGAPAVYDVDANDSSGNTKLQWACFNSVGSSLSTASSNAKAIQNIQHGDGSGDWASQFAVSFCYYQGNVNAGVTVSCQPFKDYEATTPLGPAKTFMFHPKSQTGAASNFPVCSTVFDFTDVVDGSAPIKSWQIVFTGAPSIVPPGGTLSKGLFIGYITGGPIWGNLIAHPSGTFANGLWQAQPLNLQQTAGGWIADTQTDLFIQAPQLSSLTKDARLTLSFGSGADYTVGSPSGGALPTGPATLVAYGSGYLSNTVVSFVGGGGSGAKGTVSLALDSSGVTYKVTGVTITDGGTGYTGAPTLVFGQSFASLAYISVPLNGFIQNGSLQFDVPEYAIELRLLQAGSGETYETVPLQIDSSGGFASGDLSTLAASSLACVASAQIVFIDNPIVSSAAFGFNIGALTFAGNLSVGFAAYQWVYTEVDSNGDINLVNIIESDPSPYSNSVAPTGQFATAQIVLPSEPLNTSSDKFYLYRAGGTFSDGLLRLVSAGDWSGNDWAMGGQPSKETSSTNDAPPGVQLTLSNPYTSWSQPDQNGNAAPAGMKYFVDNTPDANLENNPTVITGKQPAPSGATAIATFQNRLWLATSDGVISSWLLSAGANAGIYFNPTVDPSDPNAPIKGSGYVPIGEGDNDPVVALKTLGTVLTIWKGLSVYFIDGYDPTNFGCNQFQAIEGQGLVAPSGIAIADNLAYVAQQDGVYTFDGSQLNRISDPIGPLLAPVLNENGGVVAASAYTGIALCYHGGRLYVFAPEPNGSQNTQCLLWDARFNGWTGQWTGMNITSAVSIGTNADDPDIWLGGYDGQLYTLSGNGDTAVAHGTSVPVSFALATRAYGRPPAGLSVWMQGRYNLPLGIEDRAWEPFFRRVRPTRVWLEANSYDSSGAQSISLTIGTRYQDNGAVFSYPVTLTGWQRMPIKTNSDRGGLGVIVTVTGSTATNLQIVSAGVTVARGTRMD